LIRKATFAEKNMMQKIIVLGAGMVGKAIAADLSKTYDVTSVDVDQASLQFLSGKYGIKTLCFDVTDARMLAETIKPFDLVISAVPGFLGWQTINTVIRTGKNLVDISFLPEEVLPLDELAKAHGVTAIVDCGVAPGIPNIIAGYHYHRANISRFGYMVGGLPVERSYPFEYKAPFSPCDVIEEYTRPARMVEHGKMVIKPAMSDPELIDFVRGRNVGGF
jgi:lysine 6-dehydrogenase